MSHEPVILSQPVAGRRSEGSQRVSSPGLTAVEILRASSSDALRMTALYIVGGFER